MPRKKQGIRSYHHKSRNGCMQCKRRRVKCSMQAPTCANCLRRNEKCEYPTFLEWRPLSQPPDQIADEHAGFPTLPGSSIPKRPQTSHPPQAASDLQTLDKSTLPGDTNMLLSLLFSLSWFSPREKAIWLPALSKLAIKYPYLHHSTLALIHLREDPYTHRGERIPAIAYQHQVEASSLFRQYPPTVDEDNWLAVLAFGTCNLIFQFHTQNSCDDSQFNLVETLRAVRSNTDIQRAAHPFFQRSELWKLIMSRTNMPDAQPDMSLTQALQDLAHVISESAVNECNNDDDDASAELNRQAFWELREWAIRCQGEPRRWDHYCQWPSRVTTEYLELLDDGNDVALLIFIHWSAIMIRSCRPVVKSWVTRAAFHAIDHLQDAWGEQLAWALEVLSPSPPLNDSLHSMSMSPLLPNGTENFDPNLIPIPTMSFDMTSMSGFTEGDGMVPAQFMHTTSA